MSEPVYLFHKGLTESRAAEAEARAYRANCYYDAIEAFASSLRTKENRYPQGLPWSLFDRFVTMINEGSSAMHLAWSLAGSVHGLAARPVRKPKPRKPAAKRAARGGR